MAVPIEQYDDDDERQASVRDTARRAIVAGLRAIPPREDGTKRPHTEQIAGEWTWKHWAYEAPPSRDQLRAWWGPRTGVGIITGAPSGNVELFEFEDRDTYQVFRDTAESVGLGEVVERVEAGYLEATPGGGLHWLWRCDEIGGNEKLARHKVDDKVLPLIETRGEGGFAVIAPTWGRVHASGRAYELLRGGVETIATVTPEERRELFRVARALDQLPVEEHVERQAASTTGGRPGEDFNARAEWSEVLEPHGWRVVRRRGEVTHWRRPDKDVGISATTNWAGSGLLYVFSTSTPFEAEQGYSKWRAFAILNHAGDFKAAARELASRGYGEPTKHPSPQIRLVGGKEQATSDGDDTPPPLPRIDAGDLELRNVAAQAWGALTTANEPPFLFRYSGMPTRVEHNDDESPTARVLTEDRLRHVLARVADWHKWIKVKDGFEDRAALPPMHVVRDMLAAPEQPLPPLLAIIEAPSFAPDGSLHEQEGYHAPGKSYLALARGFRPPSVTAQPTGAEVARARTLLVEELLGDFPFVNDAERAHAIALLLLPFVRGLIDGPTPLHLIEKPSPGTGASLLADVLTYPALGRPAPAMTEGRDEDEWRKRITARLASGSSVVLIDNLRGRLDSAAVASAITSTIWTDRILGKSENILIPVRCAWIATGNNPALSSEMTRRTIRIRLNAQTDRPWLRTSFRHPDLRNWAKEQRGELAWAALTLARTWIAQGQPDPDCPTLGMFENWARVVGGVLATAGVPGFLTNLSEFYDESDSEGAEIRAFLAAWWERKEAGVVTVADLFPIATAPEITLDIASKSEQGQRQRLGRLLRGLKDRHYQLSDELTVCVRASGKRANSTGWRLDGFGKRGLSGENAGETPSLNPQQQAVFDDETGFRGFGVSSTADPYTHTHTRMHIDSGGDNPANPANPDKPRPDDFEEPEF